MLHLTTIHFKEHVFAFEVEVLESISNFFFPNSLVSSIHKIINVVSNGTK